MCAPASGYARVSRDVACMRALCYLSPSVVYICARARAADARLISLSMRLLAVCVQLALHVRYVFALQFEWFFRCRDVVGVVGMVF